MARILSVDDSRVIRTIILDYLAGLGFEIVQARDGQEAVDIVSKSAPFDLVLMDWEMPVLTGPETVARLRALGFDKPIIMVTSKADTSDISGMLEIGADDYVVKPFTRELLREKVTELLGRALAAAA